MITVSVSDVITIQILSAYCVDKSWFFNLFFGWRKTSGNTCFFRLPFKDWEKLLKIIKETY